MNDDIQRFKLVGTIKAPLAAKMIYMLFLQTAREGYVQISISTISKTLGINDRTVTRNIKILESQGHIKCLKMYHDDGGNATNKYLIK